MQLPKIAFIGAGNVAWHLAPAMHGEVAEVIAVFGRKTVPQLAWQLPYFSTIEDIPKDLAACFLAVPDNAIAEVSGQLASVLPAEVPIIHLSGATSVSKINLHFRRSGVFWPIQSLKKGAAPVDFNRIPIGYHSDQSELYALLKEWAEALSKLAYPMNDEQRAKMHLASVLGNNFSNFMLHLAHKMAAEANLPFELLIPLFDLQPADGSDPFLRQTGPAARFDSLSLKKHLESLHGQSELRDLYLLISKLIVQAQGEVSK